MALDVPLRYSVVRVRRERVGLSMSSATMLSKMWRNSWEW